VVELAMASDVTARPTRHPNDWEPQSDRYLREHSELKELDRSILQLETITHINPTADDWDAVRKGVKAIRNAFDAVKQAARDTTTTHDRPNTIPTSEEFGKLIEGALIKALQQQAIPPAQTRSYAAVAATPPNAESHWQGKVVIPARKSREVIVKSVEQPAELAKRTSGQVVAAVNTALKDTPHRAQAAKRLQSGDTVVTFEGSTAELARKDAWVKAAFGDDAKVARREIAVIAKGLPAKELAAVHDDRDLIKQLQPHNSITRVKRSLPRNNGGTYAALILHVDDPAFAKRLCESGLIWDYRVYVCEPYEPSLRITQCYNCWGYGHIGRYCGRKTRCCHCASAGHEGGEKDCPAREKEATKRCVNCSGQHAAFDRVCPVAKEQRYRAKEAYSRRPRQFELSGFSSSEATAVSSPTGTSFTILTQPPVPTEPLYRETAGAAPVASRGGRGRGRGRGRGASGLPDRLDVSQRKISDMRPPPRRVTRSETARTGSTPPPLPDLNHPDNLATEAHLSEILDYPTLSTPRAAEQAREPLDVDPNLEA
jgi:hypothetical protein